jgi:hypothetical protein
MVWCGVLSVEESGQPKLPENPAGMSATAALVWTETGPVKPTVNQKPHLMEKNPILPSKLSEFPS